MANNIVLATLSIVCRKMGSMPCAVPFAGRCIIWGLWVMRDPSDSVNVSDYLLRFPDMRETVNQVVRVAREHLPEA